MKFHPLGLAALAAAFALPSHAAGEHDGHAMHAPGHRMVSAAGQPGQPAKVTRTVTVTMTDPMRFTPDRFDVQAGETVRFFVKNESQATHEFVIGSAQELAEHAEMMKRMGGMQHHDGGMLTLKPGQRGAVVWSFGQAGSYRFGCTLPGHLEAGMKGELAVK